MTGSLNVDLVMAVFCHVTMEMQQSKYDMFFKLLVQPVLDTVATYCKLYHSMSFPCDEHIHESYICFRSLKKKKWKWFGFVYSAFIMPLILPLTSLRAFII